MTASPPNRRRAERRRHRRSTLFLQLTLVKAGGRPARRRNSDPSGPRPAAVAPEPARRVQMAPPRASRTSILNHSVYIAVSPEVHVAMGGGPATSSVCNHISLGQCLHAEVWPASLRPRRENGNTTLLLQIAIANATFLRLKHLGPRRANKRERKYHDIIE